MANGEGQGQKLTRAQFLYKSHIIGVGRKGHYLSLDIELSYAVKFILIDPAVRTFPRWFRCDGISKQGADMVGINF